MTDLLIRHSELSKLLLANFICPTVVALVVYFFSRKWDDWNKRCKNRKLAKARIESYLSDVRTGITLIKESISAASVSAKMPRESWDSYKLSDELLIEIIILRSRKSNRGFSPSTVLIRLKDYFEHICPNVESLRNSTGQNRNASLLELQESSGNVEAMLECIQCQLTSAWWQIWK